MVRRLSELSMMPASSAGRSLLIAGLLVLGLAACGRRGSLEPPRAPAAIGAGGERGAQGERLKGAPGRGARSSRSAPALEGETNVPGQAQVADGGDADDPVAEGPEGSPTVALGPT